MRRRCCLLLCNLAEPVRCPPGWDLLALHTVRAGKEQVWSPLPPFLDFFFLSIFTFLGFTVLIVCSWMLEIVLLS